MVLLVISPQDLTAAVSYQIPTQIGCYSYLKMYLEVVFTFVTILKSW